jgi:hypothetical protein
VSGGTGGAKGATLTFMCGGEDKAFAAARPVLEKMGKKIVHCGGGGAGQAAKICNNMILGVSMIAVSEAFALAEKLGLSHQALFDVASTSSGQCWSLTSYCPVPGPVPASPANNDYKPGFAFSNAASGPPTMKVSVAPWAPPTPPETGASIISIPRFSASIATARAVSTSMVEESMKSVPFFAFERIPFDPRYTSRTCCPAGSIVTTMSDCAASASDFAIAPPAATSASTPFGVTSLPATACPAFTRLRAMGKPILPSPMKPIFAMTVSSPR